MTFERFQDLYDTMNNTLEKCLAFDNAMESVVGSDTTSMLCWPIDSVDHVIMLTLIEAGCSESDAEFFVYDLKEQLEKGGTEIGVRGSTEAPFRYYEINSLKDYYAFLFENQQGLKSSFESKYKEEGGHGFITLDKDGLEVHREN